MNNAGSRSTGAAACGWVLLIDEASLYIACIEKNGSNGNALFHFKKQLRG
jgi:hypothetical protein